MNKEKPEGTKDFIIYPPEVTGRLYTVKVLKYYEQRNDWLYKTMLMTEGNLAKFKKENGIKE